MDVNAIINHLMQAEKKQLLIYACYLQAVFCFPLTISCFAVAGTANMGFNAILLTLFNCGFIGGSYYVVNGPSSPIAVGFLIGVSSMITAMNFMSSIFWGQLSGCETLDIDVPGYSCSSPGGYTAVCVFSIFLFLTQLFFTGAVAMWKDHIISEDTEQQQSYDGLPQGTNPMTTSNSVDL